MSRRSIGSVVVGVLALAAVGAPLAHSATGAKVGVRAVGPNGTLVDTVVTTTGKPVVKDGNAQHACGGASAAGAVELATKGKWAATWFDGLGYAVSAIDGVQPSGTDYWTLWVNGKSSTTGLCDTQAQAGDQVLLFICHDATAPDYSCKNRPLALAVPKRRMRAGKPVTVTVTALKDDGSAVPAAGAVVRGGAKAVTTGADGKARIALRAGQTTLRATRAGDLLSAAVHCSIGAAGGTCGSTDRTPPKVTVSGIRDGQAFTSRTAPRVLRGTATDPSGAAVELRLVRSANGRCTIYDARRESFRPCGASRPFFSAGDRARWSYLLPTRLAAGRYALAVRATDQAGNVATVAIRFTVGSVR